MYFKTTSKHDLVVNIKVVINLFLFCNLPRKFITSCTIMNLDVTDKLVYI